MNPLIFANLKAAAVGLALALLLLFYAEWQHTQATLDNYKEEVARAGAEQEAKAQATEDNYKRITEDLQNDHAKALADVRDFYARRMLPAARRPGEMPGLSKPPASIDAIPSDALPLAEQCAETTLQLIDLQHWLTDIQSAAAR